MKKGWHFRGSLDHFSEQGHEPGYAGAHELGHKDAGNDGNAGSDQDVHTGLFRHQLSQLRSHNGGHQSAHGSSQLIACDPTVAAEKRTSCGAFKA